MTTCTYVSRLKSLAKRVESVVQSFQSAAIQPSKDQYQVLEALSVKVATAAAKVPAEVNALKKRNTAPSCVEGKKYISQAQSDREETINNAQLKNRSVFGRNISLIFKGPLDSVVDSSTTKTRKHLVRKRCKSIGSLNPDGVISWAVAYTPTTWTAHLMSNDTFDYLVEHIEPQDAIVWPPEIYDMLRGLGAEEPLQGSHGYQEFLKAAEESAARAQSSIQPRKRRRIEDGLASGTEHLSMVPQHMALVVPSCYRDHSSLRYEQQKLAAVDSWSPDDENREMKHMYTNAPASNISKLPEPFRSAVQNSRLWKWERSKNLLTTGCWPSLFPQDHTQDVSFTIWCGQNDGYQLTDFFGSELATS